MRRICGRRSVPLSIGDTGCSQCESCPPAGTGCNGELSCLCKVCCCTGTFFVSICRDPHSKSEIQTSHHFLAPPPISLAPAGRTCERVTREAHSSLPRLSTAADRHDVMLLLHCADYAFRLHLSCIHQAAATLLSQPRLLAAAVQAAAALMLRPRMSTVSFCIHEPAATLLSRPRL